MIGKLKSSVFRKLIAGYAGITLFFIFAVLLYSFFSFRSFYHSTIAADQKHITKVLSEELLPAIPQGAKAVQTRVKNLAHQSSMRITVIDPQGKVLADSDHNTQTMENHLTRSEVLQALQGSVGVAERFSQTMHRPALYVAAPITVSGQKYIIRTCVYLRDINTLFLPMVYRTVVAAAIFLVIILWFGYVFARRITLPLQQVAQAARKLAAGELQTRVLVETNDEIQRLADSFNAMAEQIQEVSRIKRDFVTNASHELRTPLTSIKGFAETLMEELSGDQRRYAEIIRNNADRLMQLVQDIMLLSDLESRQILNKETIDFTRLIREVVSLFEPTAQKKNIQITLKCPDRISITADAFKLQQVFINLIDNALKYSERGTISVEVSQEQNQVIVQVKDTGLGIPVEDQERIFERFYVVDKSRSRQAGGTGLGLSIVKHIVTMHNGTIEVQSRPGLGSTFIVKLPV